MTKRSRPVRRETTRKRTSPRLAPRRVVDPTGWLERCRRLARDFERLTAHAEAMIHIAMTGLMLRPNHPCVSLAGIEPLLPIVRRNPSRQRPLPRAWMDLSPLRRRERWNAQQCHHPGGDPDAKDKQGSNPAKDLSY